MLSATVLPCTAVRAWHGARLSSQIPGRCPGHLSPAAAAPRRTTGGGMHEARCPWHKTKSREKCVYIQSQCVPRRPAWWRTCAPSPCQCPTTARIVATLCRNPAGNLQSPNAAFLRADNPARRGHAADTNQTAETHLTLLQTKCPDTHSYRSIVGTPSTKIRPPKPISLFYKQSARKPTATGASGARRR